MLTRRSTPATNMRRIFAVALGVLLCASAHAALAAGSGAADALPSDAPLYGYFREAGYAPELVRRTVNLPQIPPPAGNLLHVSFEGEARQPAVLARLHQAFGGDLRLSSGRARPDDPEVALRNADALVRAKAGLTLGGTWLGFVYADMGAVDSALRWQGLAGIRGGKGFDLFGGWRRVTYHFSPGMGFDSLDFNGPVLGARLAW
jgi:hypothetical protein